MKYLLLCTLFAVAYAQQTTTTSKPTVTQCISEKMYKIGETLGTSIRTCLESDPEVGKLREDVNTLIDAAEEAQKNINACGSDFNCLAREIRNLIKLRELFQKFIDDVVKAELSDDTRDCITTQVTTAVNNLQEVLDCFKRN